MAIPVNLLNFDLLCASRIPLQVQVLRRLRVRRPISGLVRDNYPSGRTATYRFIPEQTTLELYMIFFCFSIGKTPDYEIFFDIFDFFRSAPCAIFLILPCVLINTRSGVSRFGPKRAFQPDGSLNPAETHRKTLYIVVVFAVLH